MDMSRDCFTGFALRVDRILQCRDPDAVATALRDIAVGKSASIDGDVVEPLSGLGQRLSTNVNDAYRDTMLKLLEWGMRNYVVDPSVNASHLWGSMKIIDGLEGFNQDLMWQPVYINGRLIEREEPGISVETPTAPRIVEPTEEAEIRPLEINTDFVADFLKTAPGARSVTIISSSFGWPKLFLDRIHILYADADDVEDLALRTLRTHTHAVIIPGRLKELGSDIDEARQLVEPPAMAPLDKSARKLELRRLRFQPSRVTESVRPFRHGQSISSKGVEGKGSIAVFLSMVDDTRQESCALTAFHVVSHGTDNNETSSIVTPGGLDILCQLHKALEAQDENSIKFFLERWRQKCGTISHGRIGVNQNGFREDWALISLDPQWRGSNGSWFSREELTELYAAMRGRGFDLNSPAAGTTFAGSNGVVRCLDPVAGMVCYKDGATTGYTAGRVWESMALTLRKGTDEGASSGEAPVEGIETAKLLTVFPVPDREERFVAGGDCGGGVYYPLPQEDGWAWLGQLVRIFYPAHTGGIVGLMVPQSEIFRSINVATGREWRLSA